MVTSPTERKQARQLQLHVSPAGGSHVRKNLVYSMKIPAKSWPDAPPAAPPVVKREWILSTLLLTADDSDK